MWGSWTKAYDPADMQHSHALSLMPIPLIDYAGLTTDEQQRIAVIHSGLSTLAGVLDWARAEKPPLAVEEIITQDEYTHDVLIPDRQGHYLVYDTT